MNRMQKEIDALDIWSSRCNYFVPDLENDLKCQCGLFKDRHNEIAIQHHLNFGVKKNITWNPKICTADDKKTDAFGTLDFENNDVQIISKFCRISHRTELEKTYRLLFNVWKLKEPKLIISVTGGANLMVKPKIRDIFCNGVVKAAYSTQGWITTGGSYAGVMRYVGEAAKNDIRSLNQDERIVVLGISNWTSIANKEELVYDKSVEQPIKIKMSDFKYDKTNKSELLDPNHTHFLLVDNSHQNHFGGEIEYRARFEAYMNKTVKVGDYDGVPVVMIVLEGGPNTARQVIHSVKKKIPCIFVNKSGRFSDIFSFIYDTVEDMKNSNKNKKEMSERDPKTNKFKFSAGLLNKIEHMIRTEFPSKDKNKILEKIEEIFQPEYRHLLSVFDLNADKNAGDIDESILNGLFKAKKDNYQSIIRLCLVWNRVDMARKYIFTSKNKMSILSLDSLMEDAIIKNRVEFVELFLENGYNIKTYLTYGKLLNLYNRIPATSDLYKLLYEQVGLGLSNKKLKAIGLNKIFFTFKDIGYITQRLLDSLYEHRFTKSPFREITGSKAQQVVIRNRHGIKLSRFGMIWLKSKKSKDDEHVILDKHCELPDHELFMLNILLQRYDMAMIFWREGKNQIGASLIASLIFNSYIANYDKDTTKYKELVEKSKYFENLACGTLQRCDESDELKTQQLLMRRINEFGESTPIQISIAANAMDFIAHPSFQYLTVVVWYNKILPDTPNLFIMTSVILPFLAPWILHFRDKKPNAVENSVKKTPKVEEDDEQEESDNEEEEVVEELEESGHIENTFEKRSKLVRLDYSLDFFDSGRDLNYWERIYHFFRTPLIKFLYNQLFYIVFLLLFSYVMLCDFYPIDLMLSDASYPKVPEIILLILLISYLVEEIRKVFHYDNKLFRQKLSSYLSEFLNSAQMFGLLLFLIGAILRFIPNKECYLAARIFLSIDLIFWYLKTLVCFTPIKSLGPKITMIGVMTKELINFMPLILITMFAYGISTYALQYHNTPPSWSLVKKIFFPGYFIIGGEHYELDGIMSAADSVCFQNFTTIIDFTENQDCREPRGSQVSLVLYVIYLLFMFILLQNLLIAIFSDVYETVDAQSDKIWKYQRYFLSYEYFHKPFLVPPFVLLYHLFYLFKLCLNVSQQLCCKEPTPGPGNNRLRRIFARLNEIYMPGLYFTAKNVEEANRFVRFESYLAKEHKSQLNKKQKLTANYKITQNHEKVNTIQRKYEGIVEIRQNLGTKLESIEGKLERILGYVNGNKPVRIDQSVINTAEIKSARTSIKQATKNRENLQSTSGSKLQDKKEEKNSRKPDLNSALSVSGVDPNIKSPRPKNFLTGTDTPPVEIPHSLDPPETPQALDNSFTHTKPENMHSLEPVQYKEVYPSKDSIQRFYVRKKYSRWSMPWKKYQPVKYTSEKVLSSAKADIDLLAYSAGNLNIEIAYNEYDDKYNVNRKSLHTYEINELRLPLNPLGRTGIFGRGRLYFWGPNYAVNAIFIRYNRNTEKNEVMVSLQEETNRILFPLIFNENLHYDEDNSIKIMIFNLFDFKYLNDNPDKYAELTKFIQVHSEKIDEYIMGSNLNTDNAWVENTVVVYHDALGAVLGDIPLNLNAWANRTIYKWVELNEGLASQMEPESAKYFDKAMAIASHHIS